MGTFAFIGALSGLVVAFLVILGLLLPLLALISVLTGRFPGNEKLVWVLVIIFLPYLGSILYFIVGKQNRMI